MQKKKKLYYGMTGMQVATLGTMAALFFCVVMVGLLFVLRNPSQPAVQVATQVPPPTRIPTSVNQPTDEVATLTPEPIVATKAPPADWVEFKSQEATLWLPPSFVGGDMVSKRQESIDKVRRLGKLFGGVVEGMRDADKEVVLTMVDKTLRETDIIPVVSVHHGVSTEDTSLDDYLQTLFEKSAQGTPIAMVLATNEVKKMTILGREAKRWTFSRSQAAHGVTSLVYCIKDGADFWTIFYSMSPNEYFDMLPMVEQSIQTFNIVK